MTLLILGALTGCNRYYPGTEDHIRLEWKEGETFHLATRELKAGPWKPMPIRVKVVSPCRLQVRRCHPPPASAVDGVSAPTVW